MTTNDVAWDGVARGYIPQEPLTISPDLPLHTTALQQVDPVTYEVVRYSLASINAEHGQTLQRLCVSPVTMLARDFQPSILTESADLVFLGPYLQYFSNAQALTIKWILENRSDDPGIAPGDVFLSNDPYVGTPHQPDTIVAAPVFVGEQLFCWVANVLHHTDVGGTVPGSFCVDAQDIFADPPAFPPFKLVSGGRIRTDLEQLFLRQSRAPMNVHMDLRAALSAAHVAVESVQGLVQRYGADVVKAVMNGILDAGERTFVARLAGVPNGTWTHRLYAEGAHTGDPATYAYQLTVTKRGSDLYVDNAGTDPQAGSINVTYAGLAGAFLAALTAAMVSDLAGAYGGVYRRVHFDPVPGTLSCADFPAAVSPSGVFTMETLISLSGSVISKMLACGDEPTQALAIGLAHPSFYGVITAGMRATGQPFIATNADNMIGALGATPYEDGVDFGGHFWIPEGMASNVEELELLWPNLILYRSARPMGADGAGRYRGGRTLREGAIPWGVPGMAAALYVDESFPKSVGPFGANPSSAGKFRVKHQTDVADLLAAGTVPTDLADLSGIEQPTAAKGPMLMLGPDTVFEWSAANAAGYGDPLQRDPSAVLADVLDGVIDETTAADVYGVVVARGAVVDDAATAQHRAALLRDRLAAITGTAGDPVADTARVRSLGGELGVVVDPDGRPIRFVTLTGRADLGRVDGNYKDGCAIRERPLRAVAPEFGTTDDRSGWNVLLREYLCPRTGLRVGTEILRDGDEPLHDIRLAV